MTDILQHAVLHRKVDHETAGFTAICLGKEFGDMRQVDWTLPSRTEEINKKVAGVLQALGADIYYAPNTSKPNADRIHRSVLQKPIPLPGSIRFFGNKEVPGEVITIGKDEGVVFNPSSCPTVVVSFGGYLDVLHAGRRSLLDERRIRDESSGCRFNESVVDTAIRHLRARTSPEKVWVWVFGSAPVRHIPYHLSSGPWATHNRQMLGYIHRQGWGECLEVEDDVFYIDLPLLVRAQFKSWQVPGDNVDLTCAHWGPRAVEQVWLDGTTGTPRNLKIIVRHH